MRLVGVGPGGFVGVSVVDGAPLVTVEPPERRAEVVEAMGKSVTVEVALVPQGGEIGDIADGLVELQPGQPGHALAVLDALPWLDTVEDLDAGPTIEAEE